jgi:UDP:flavonoid glycosyltransferase YjiC (YdhE family)
LVERFGCGVTFSERTPRGLAAAIDAALENWDEICAGAQEAARALAAEHDPAHLARVLARAE